MLSEIQRYQVAGVASWLSTAAVEATGPWLRYARLAGTKRGSNDLLRADRSAT